MMERSRLVSCDFTDLPAFFHDGHVHIDLPDGRPDEDGRTLRTVLPIMGLNGTGKTMMLHLLALADGLCHGMTPERSAPIVQTLALLTVFDRTVHRGAYGIVTEKGGRRRTFEGDNILADSTHPRVKVATGEFASIGLATDDDVRPLSKLQPDITLLRIFMPDVASVRYPLAWDSDGNAKEPTTLHYEDGGSRPVWDSQIPRGTLRGLNILKKAQRILRWGGLMLVDGLEEGLNTEIANTVLDLFRSPVCNPHHAVLAFSTHRPELLDHVPEAPVLLMERRDDGVHARTIPPQPYEDRYRVRRSLGYRFNEWGGTAPKARDIDAMRAYMRRVVAGEESDHA